MRKTVKFVKAGPGGLGSKLSRALDRTGQSFWDAILEIGDGLPQESWDLFEDAADKIMNDAIKAIVKTRNKFKKT